MKRHPARNQVSTKGWQSWKRANICIAIILLSFGILPQLLIAELPLKYSIKEDWSNFFAGRVTPIFPD